MLDEFVRELDLITDDNLFSTGAPLGEGLGRLFVVTGTVDAPKVSSSFPVPKPDHQILAVADIPRSKISENENDTCNQGCKFAYEGSFDWCIVRGLYY